MRIVEEESMVIVVDIQERLFEHIAHYQILQEKVCRFLDAIALFEMPIFLAEQYPKGLGHTIPSIKERLRSCEVYEKVTFSCCQNPLMRDALLTCKKKSAIVVGVETHVCVLQTCLDLLEMGIQPFLVVDCVGSRESKDHDVALHRLAHAGVILTTYESIVFEVCGSAKHSAFKAMSQIVK